MEHTEEELREMNQAQIMLEFNTMNSGNYSVEYIDLVTRVMIEVVTKEE